MRSAMHAAWLTDTVTPDLDRALHYTLLWGLDAVELRTVGGASDRVPHVNEEKLRRRLDEHEVPVAAVVPGLFEGPASARAARLNEVMELDASLRFCARVGCSRVVVSSCAAEDGAAGAAADVLRRAADAGAQHGVTIAVLNEPGMRCETGAALAALLDAAGHPALRAAWSPATAVLAGENPQAGLDALAGRVALVRCANTTAEGAPAPLGEGVVDWRAQLRTLAAQGFAGPLSLELHLEPKPRWGLREATALLERIREARRGSGAG